MVVMEAVGGTWEMGLSKVGQGFVTGFKMPSCREPGGTKNSVFQKIRSAERILGGNHQNWEHFGKMRAFSCFNDRRHSPSLYGS